MNPKGNMASYVICSSPRAQRVNQGFLNFFLSLKLFLLMGLNDELQYLIFQVHASLHGANLFMI